MAHPCNQNETLLGEEAENDAVMITKESDAVIVVAGQLLHSVACGIESEKLNLLQCFDFYLIWQAGKFALRGFRKLNLPVHIHASGEPPLTKPVSPFLFSC